MVEVQYLLLNQGQPSTISTVFCTNDSSAAKNKAYNKTMVRYHQQTKLLFQLVAAPLLLHLIRRNNNCSVHQFIAAAHYPHYVKTKHDPSASHLSTAAQTIHHQSRQLRRSGGRIARQTTSSLEKSSSSSSSVLPQTKIIGGSSPPQGRFPYIASLTYFGSHLCGGSLIAPDLILTAAHCAGYASEVELGRYDRSKPFTEGVHERISVAFEVKHPQYNAQVVDNDFMLVKLLEPSKLHPVITLNTNIEIPAKAGEELTVAGWGDTDPDPDVHTPSAQLLQVQLEYIPNDVCKETSGFIEDGDSVSYKGLITNNMLCAMDKDGVKGGGGNVDTTGVDEDTCQGDSGSPMIVAGASETGEGDIQVGVVSWGIGCVSETFPGVYSRVSSQYEWIQMGVCQHSISPPANFNCDDVDINATAAQYNPGSVEEDDQYKSFLTLEISLDAQPQEFSWALTDMNGKFIASIPPMFYYGHANYTFHHKVGVERDQFFKISLRDQSGNGSKGYVAIYRGGAPMLSNLIMYDNLFRGSAVKGLVTKDHAFYAGKKPPNYFSLVIKFDKFASDTWWKLESITDNVILGQRPPKFYNEPFELLTIVEKIPIFAQSDVQRTYKFTIGDEYACEDKPGEICGDGMCCNYGQGSFTLYAGDVEAGIELASGGEFTLHPPPLRSKYIE
jgi:trypsin